MALGVVSAFLIVVGVARAAGAWHGQVPESVYFELVPSASGLGHP